MSEPYNLTAKDYREGDEIHLQGEEYRRKAATLDKLSRSFPEKIKALDLGCGTGRYFHCIKNADLLVGVDTSEEMLRIARKPVKADQVEGHISLFDRNFCEVTFTPELFHLVYSIGVFGNGCPLTRRLLRRVCKWMKPGGILYLDLLDASSIPLLTWARKRLKAEIYRRLPSPAQRAWNRRSGWPPFYFYGRTELQFLFWIAGFRNIRIESRESILTQGLGRKYEVIATRPAVPEACRSSKPLRNFGESAVEPRCSSC